jgi:hypothetical protein
LGKETVNATQILNLQTVVNIQLWYCEMGQPGIITSWVDLEATKKQLITYLALDKCENCMRHIGKVVTGV